MRLLRFAVFCLFIAALALPQLASAECYVFVNDYGELRTDSDCDGLIDYTDETDSDYDSIPDGEPVDNCRFNANGDCDDSQFNCDANGDSMVTDVELNAGYQRDWDDNGVGDVCDDADLDGVTDYLDNCKSVANPDQDASYCTDSDGDKFEDAIDNCVETYNPQQLDTDMDGVGDWCDNCRLMANADQFDSDDDGVGDVCEGGDYIAPDLNPPEDQELNQYDRDYYDFGPDQMEGNGFGKGGCSLGTASADGGMALMLIASLLLTALRRRS